LATRKLCVDPGDDSPRSREQRGREERRSLHSRERLEVLRDFREVLVRADLIRKAFAVDFGEEETLGRLLSTTGRAGLRIDDDRGRIDHACLRERDESEENARDVAAWVGN